MKSIYDIRRDNLRRLIADKFGGRNVDFARAIGLEQSSYVSRLLSDKPSTVKKIGDDLSRKIETACSLVENWMDNIHGAVRTDVLDSAITEGYVRLRLLAAMPTMGPGGAPVDHPETVRYVDVLREYIVTELHANPERIDILPTRGDSMAGTINHGDIVFVDRTVRTFDGNGVYVIVWNDQLMVKRLQAMMDGRLAIRSDNQVYETEYVAGTQADQLSICGRVVGSWGLKKI